MQINKLIIDLIKYIIVFSIVVCIIGGLFCFFYSNVNKMNKEISIDSEYRKLNLYLLNTTKNSVTISKYGLVNIEDTLSYYITFVDANGEMNTFVKLEDKIYFNKIKLCDNVEEFKVIVDKSEKEKINVEVIIDGKKYDSQYVL